MRKGRAPRSGSHAHYWLMLGGPSARRIRTLSALRASGRSSSKPLAAPSAHRAPRNEHPCRHPRSVREEPHPSDLAHPTSTGWHYLTLVTMWDQTLSDVETIFTNHGNTETQESLPTAKIIGGADREHSIPTGTWWVSMSVSGCPRHQGCFVIPARW